MSSLQKALVKTSLPVQSVESDYGVFTTLIERLLGIPSKEFISLTHGSPLTLRFLLGSFRLCLRTPYCDMHLLRITPEHRRTALLESSLTHRCPYCTGHATALGDMLRGPVVEQCTRRGDMMLTRSPSEATLKQLVREVCAFPGRLTADTRAKFVETHGEDGYRQLASMLSFMGFLNFVMLATGMHLESKLLPFAELSLKQRDINMNLRETVLDDDEEHIGEEEVRNVAAPRGPMGWLFAHLHNAFQCLMLVVPISSAMIAESAWFRGIPNDLVELDAWCLDNLGVLLRVLKNVDYSILKRATAFSLKLLFTEGSAWTLRQKSTFLYVFASGVGNETLKDDAVALYMAASVGDKDRAEQQSKPLGLGDALAMAKSSEEPLDRFSAALRYMNVCAGPGARLTKDVIDGLLRYVSGHGDIVDLAGMVGHFGFLNRASVLYPARD